MEPIKLKDVSVRIGDYPLLNNLSLNFATNKVTAIIGKSGSGKSTLLKTINGLQRVTHGIVTVFGLPVDYDQLPALRKKIGYVVQGIGLFPHLTVEENILLPGKTHLKKDELKTSRISELITLAGLSDHILEKYPHELSGGEQQRAGICRALFLDPPVLLMDEPFGSLDPITRYDIHQQFLLLQKNAPRTVLLVTHDMREARKLADDILVIDNGTVQQFGPINEIFEHPATAIVKELLTMAEV